MRYQVSQYVAVKTLSLCPQFDGPKCDAKPFGIGHQLRDEHRGSAIKGNLKFHGFPPQFLQLDIKLSFENICIITNR